jgi:hypothetical protein
LLLWDKGNRVDEVYREKKKGELLERYRVFGIGDKGNRVDRVYGG